MTDKEIKFELAKAALSGGASIEAARAYYEWVSAAPEPERADKFTEWDVTPIEQLAYKTSSEGAIIKRCHENGIKTIGDLIRCGAHKFLTFSLVGGGTISKIDEALEEYFGFSNWYLT